MPTDLGTWGFIISLLCLFLMYPVGVLINWTTPMIKDWWASRSIRSIEKQIAYLEGILTKPIVFDDVALVFFRRLFLSIVLLAYGLALIVLSLLYPKLPQVQFDLRAASALILGSATCVGLVGLYYAKKCNRKDIEAYNKEILERISKLKAKLISYQPEQTK